MTASERASHSAAWTIEKTREKTGAQLSETETGLGHWRNRWQVPEKHAHLAREQGALPLGDGTWLGYRRFETEVEAERHARKYVVYNLLNFEIRYLGPEFFPDY